MCHTCEMKMARMCVPYVNNMVYMCNTCGYLICITHVYHMYYTYVLHMYTIFHTFISYVKYVNLYVLHVCPICTACVSHMYCMCVPYVSHMCAIWFLCVNYICIACVFPIQTPYYPRSPCCYSEDGLDPRGISIYHSVYFPFVCN